MTSTYKVVRFYFDKNDPGHLDVVESGLTLEQARTHCKRADSREAGVWFDGYDNENESE